MSCEVIILAAGRGSRMFSARSKILHRIAGKSMLNHQLDSLARVQQCERIHLVVGHDRDQVVAEVSRRSDRDAINIVDQHEQLGTGHAAAQAVPACQPQSVVLVLAADIPLISTEVIEQLYARAGDAGLSLLEAEVDDPFGYGRLVRSQQGEIVAIVEEKDATEKQKAIRNIYSSALAARVDLLTDWLSRITNDNSQSEYYLTDVVGFAVKDGLKPAAVRAGSIFDYYGINSRGQLAQINKLWQSHQAWQLVERGLGLIDPERFDLRGTIDFDQDVEIDVNVIISGRVRLGKNVRIGANCYLENCTIADGTVIHPFSHLCNASLGRNCIVGPYARLRPDSQLADDVRVGNFVEVKKSQLGDGVKVNHLSYIGDAAVGQLSNVGAGTITCNYDGTSKHTTRIGEQAFIGSNTSLVAPVELGDNITIAAGSVITHNVPSGALAVSRTKQRNIPDWGNKRDEEQTT